MTARRHPRRMLAAFALGIASALALGLPAAADNFTLRIGSGHPSGPSVCVNLVENVFVPEVTRRVAEETSHTVTFIQA